MDQDALLAAYVKRLLDLQYGLNNAKPLTDAQLKKIAVESGLPEDQWDAWLQQAETHYQRGQSYNTAGNWEDAYLELKQAVSFYPNHAEANYELARACLQLSIKNSEPAKEQEFEVYVAHCLALEPLHQGAMALKTKENELDAYEAATQKSSKRKLFVRLGIAVAMLLVGHMVISSSVNSQRESVKAAWAQVENVYQRRADLIPKLTATVEAAAGFERSTLLALQEQVADAPGAVAPNNFTPAAIEAYAGSQARLGAVLNQTLAEAARQPRLQSMEGWLDLQVQIEGAENRIAIERRNYNKTVELYNRKIGGFPFSLYGYEPMPYHKDANPH